eukprot:6492444-Amphidinium_carterae.2
MVVVHNTLDTLSYWAPAREIWQAMDEARTWAGMSLLRRKTFSRQASRNFRQGHNYWKMTFDEVVEELVVLRSDPPLTMEARQRFIEVHCGSSSGASSSFPMASSSGDFSVSVTMLEVPPPPPPLPHIQFLPQDDDDIPTWVTDYERAIANVTKVDEEEIPSWATDFGKERAAQVIATTSQLSPSSLLPVQEEDDYNHYWAMQTMAPARLPPPPPVVVMGSDSATSPGQPPSSPRSSSPDSFHSCDSIKAADEERRFQAVVEESFIPIGAPSSSIPEDFAVVTPLPKIEVPEFENEFGSCAPAALPDHQADTDYISDDDYEEESSIVQMKKL